MGPHDYPHVGVANIIRFNNYVLIGLRKGDHASNMWGFPGGHLEMWESFEEAAVRETKEETGLEIKPYHVKLWWIENTFFKEEKKQYVVIFMVTDYAPNMGKPVNLEPDKLVKWQWREWFHLPQPLMPGIKQLINSNKVPPGIMKLEYW